MTKINDVPVTDEMLRDLAGRIFRNTTPAMGFDQGDSDLLYAVAHRLATQPNAQSDGWQPIKTAPKDGARILVWSTTRPPHYEDQAYIETICKGGHVEEVQPAVWLEEFQEWETHYIGTPLFWMPLPAPPTLRNQTKGSTHD